MAPRPARTPKPPKRWQRAEAGRHRSSDERFSLESDGGGRWFVTDAESLDELGLARTTGPFPTLETAKAAADATRDQPAEASPLAARIAEAAARPGRSTRGEPAKRAGSAPKRGHVAGSAAEPRPRVEAGRDATSPAGPGTAAAQAPGRQAKPKADGSPVRTSAPAPVAASAPRTWLDDLEDGDRDAAVRARRLVKALDREGIGDAGALVRRDLLGGTPAIATRLMARAVLAAIAGLRNPSTADVAEAVASVLASSTKRAGLPGWELIEHDGPAGQRRGMRLTADDLRAAAEDEADR